MEVCSHVIGEMWAVAFDKHVLDSQYSQSSQEPAGVGREENTAPTSTGLVGAFSTSTPSRLSLTISKHRGKFFFYRT